MGASMLLQAAVSRSPAAIISSGTGPAIFKILPAEQRSQGEAHFQRQLAALPAGQPKLFIVGDADKFSPKSLMEESVALVSEPKAHHVVTGAQHNFEGIPTLVDDAADIMVKFAIDSARDGRDRKPYE